MSDPNLLWLNAAVFGVVGFTYLTLAWRFWNGTHAPMRFGFIERGFAFFAISLLMFGCYLQGPIGNFLTMAFWSARWAVFWGIMSVGGFLGHDVAVAWRSGAIGKRYRKG